METVKQVQVQELPIVVMLLVVLTELILLHAGLDLQIYWEIHVLAVLWQRVPLDVILEEVLTLANATLVVTINSDFAINYLEGGGCF